ncbi:tetratricopeptide repeat protein [Polymorphobacter arshaanensis]|uniref:Tetratricopeptide repeat protein n=1 Tax=Glacieibacterium arshaanense TaxID=2511025 RepID=A0A4Y9EQW2_9SPHN|nr:tetratricopeptide repeat protein [Polymorphobacter arshaanensis]TFU05995.1 tetratricopeptide repeat protein [Polymorphobacter arshaanensis]
MTAEPKHYRAFISYSHADKHVATWLHGAVERYHVPAKLVGTETALGPVPKRLTPIFRDRDELPASGDLSFELKSALENSLCLLLICSPSAAKSRWVNEEVKSFKRMHGEGRIFALIASGEPGHPDSECFPPALQYTLGPDGELSDIPAEPIAADMRKGKDGKRLALFKLLAGLTGLKLDLLVQREAARRARRLAIIASASVIGMFGALGLAYYANTQRIAAIEQRKIAETESAAARAAADYLVGTFELANPATENPRTITALTILGRSADRARTELAGQPAIQLRLLDTVARAYNNLGLFDEARDALERSKLIIDKAGPQGANAMVTLATTLYRQGNLDGAVRTAQVAEAKLAADPQDNDGRNRQVRARAREIMAAAYTDQTANAKALAAYDQALALFRASPGAKQTDIARVLNNRGLLLSGIGRYDDARKSLSEANQIYRLVYSDAHLTVGQSYFAIATNEYYAGKLPEAQAQIERALAVYDRVLDPDNYIRADALMLEGQIARDQRRPADAVKALTQAVDVYRKSFGKPHYLIGTAEVYLALALSDLGRTSEALRQLDDAKINYDVSYGKLHPNHGDLMVNRAVILAKAGRHAEARGNCAKGLAILEKTMGKSDGFYKSSAATCAALMAKVA